MNLLRTFQILTRCKEKNKPIVIIIEHVLNVLFPIYMSILTLSIMDESRTALQLLSHDHLELAFPLLKRLKMCFLLCNLWLKLILCMKIFSRALYLAVCALGQLKNKITKVSFLTSLIRPQKAKHPTVLIIQKDGWFSRFVWKKRHPSVSVPIPSTVIYTI